MMQIGGCQSKIKTVIIIANSVDPGTACNEPSHLDLYGLHMCLFRSARLKWLTYKYVIDLNLCGQSRKRSDVRARGI